MSLNNSVDGFDVKNTTTSRIKSNNKTILNVGINYRWLAFNLNFAPKIFQENIDDNIKGKTKSFGLGFSSNFNHFIQKMAYSRIKGYYLGNTRDFDPNWKTGDPYIQFPGLVYRSFSGQTAYKFNDNFSFNAITSQTERQLKSAGTFLPSVFYQYYIVNDRTPLPGQNASQKSKTLQVVFSPGYYHTFVAEHNFYATGGLNPGIGFSRTKLISRQPSGSMKTRLHGTVIQLESTLTLGYNSTRFFTGFTLQAATRGYTKSNANNVILDDKAKGTLFIGYRFNAPRRLTSAMEKAEKLAAEKLEELKTRKPE